MVYRTALVPSALTVLAWFTGVNAFAGSSSYLVVQNKACRSSHGLARALRMSETQYGETRLQVITDIDDTVKSSGGLRLLGKLGVNIGPALGGLDTQYKRNDFYPGVFQFGAELASYGLPPNMQPAPMAVLTARAREFKVFLALKPSTALCLKYNEAADKLFKSFGKGAASWGIDTESTVLYGSVVEWILQYRKGWRKYDNFLKLRSQNDDRVRYVLVGDTGEYDEECGERMVAECPQLVRGLFFHVVSENDWRQLGEKGIQLPADKAIDGVPVSYFRTYVGAARKAFKCGLLGPEELLRVISQSQLDLKSVARDDFKWSDLRRDTDVAIIELGHFLAEKEKEKEKKNASKVTAAAAPVMETVAGAGDVTDSKGGVAGKKRGWLGRLKDNVFG